MNEHIEIEYKILLSKEKFFSILKYYQKQINHDYIQINYYLTHPILEEKKYMLRIREKDNHFEFTLKRPFQNHVLETNVSLNTQEKDDILQHHFISNEITDILRNEGIDILDLKNQFSLTTHRYDILLKEGILSLDYNTYLNQQDYELEFEVYDEENGYLKFLEILQMFQLEYHKNCPSKISRVFNTIKKEG